MREDAGMTAVYARPVISATAGEQLIGIPPQIAPPTAFGPAFTDTSGLAVVHGLAGGQGAARVKTLLNGAHVAPPGIHLVQYAELSPGVSWGRHAHPATEEFYFICRGSARMAVNGRMVDVAAHDLITAPQCTVHGISVPAGAAEGVAVFALEAMPAGTPSHAPKIISVRQRMMATEGWRDAETSGRWEVPSAMTQFPDLDAQVRAGSIDLRQHLSGPLRRFTLIEIPGGGSARGTLGPYRLPPHHGEILFVVSGSAEILAAREKSAGGPGLTVATGVLDGRTVRIRNLDPEDPLIVISTEVAA